MTITLDSVNADLQTFKTQVPSLEGLLFSMTIPAWEPLAGTPGSVEHYAYRTTLLIGVVPLTILSVGLSFEAWTLAASSTAYWQADLQVGTGPAGWTTVATRTTQSTGANANGGVTARSPWTFDAATSSGPISVAQGQLLAITWTPVGSPPDMDLPVTYTVRYAEA